MRRLYMETGHMSVEDRLSKLERQVEYLVLCEKARTAAQILYNETVLKSMVDFDFGPAAKPASTPEPPRDEFSLSALPSDLQDKVEVQSAVNSIIVKPKAYLGGENFKKIHEIVEKFKGEWISEGKLGHWKIPREVS